MDILQLSRYEERSYGEVATPRGWISYGEDNMFPQYLVDLYKNSATHGALVTTIAQMIFAEGVTSGDIETRLKIQEWGLNDVLRKACIDLKIQGGFALEIKYSIDRTSIAEIKHCPFENIRSGEADDYDSVDWYWYSRDWCDTRETPQQVRAFSPKDKNDHPTQILYINPFSPGSFYYPKPDYIGSVNYIELDKEISKYHINNIRNGLAPSFTIHFKNGVPSPEERSKIRNDIERQLAGTTNAGKFIITYSDQPERKPDFEPFPLSDADKQYQFLSTETTDKIMVGHRVVSPAMFGVKTSGQLGSTQELEISSELFERQVVRPYQRIVKDAIDRLVNASDLSGTIEIVVSQKSIVVEATKHQQTELPSECADWLLERGESMTDRYELIDERNVDYETESVHDAAWHFAYVPSANESGESRLDNEIVKVRYSYDGKIKGNSREFCRKMVNSDKVFRKEDIEAAGNKAVNKGWGAKGANTYDIFKYKGGGNCHHRWIRRTYLQKDNKNVSVAEAKRIINKLPYEERIKNLIPNNDPAIASQMPYTMPDAGFLPSNKNH